MQPTPVHNGVMVMMIALRLPHFCGALIAVIGDGLLRARSAAIFEPADILPLPKNLTGWLARFPCPKRRAMVELTPGAS